MLRAILTAHISQGDLKVLTLQMNGRALGHLSSEKTVNHVISGNREVHVIAGFYSFDDTPREKMYMEEQLHSFAEIFKEMQTGGLASLSQLSEKFQPEAAFVTIASTEMFLIWQDRQKGVYLQRKGKLFRLQPTFVPGILSACDNFTRGDFYAFKPQDDDLLLFLTPTFVERFKAEQLEEVFAMNQQLHAKMKTLTNLGETYGFNFEQSWFAVHVQRAEEHQIYSGSYPHDGINGDKGMRISMLRDLYDSLEFSKVTKVALNPRLFPVQGSPAGRKMSRNSEYTPVRERAKRPQLGDWKKAKEKQSRIEPIDHSRQEKRRQTLHAYENRRARMDPMLDRIREFSFDPLIRRMKKRLIRYFHLWPRQPLVSFVFASATILALFLFLIFAFKALADKQKQPAEIPAKESLYVTEETAADAVASAPLATNLEVMIVVKANTLQIRQAADVNSALLASVNRGDTVTQLAPEENGWVYIRSSDGTEGFADAEYLYE